MARKNKGEIRIVCRGDVLKPVDEIVPYERNAKIHGEKQLAALRKSLRTLGFVRPLLIDAKGNLIAGHGTLMAAKAEGMTAVPCNLAEGLTDAQRRAYILADNRLAEMAEWDMPMVLSEIQALELEDVDLSMLDFDLGEMALDSAPEEPEPAQEDDFDPDAETPENSIGGVLPAGTASAVCWRCYRLECAERLNGRGESQPAAD